ncbi:MAG TPA: sensor domain-containing diguanylate cyclase [Dongiaceae bacterium]|nr:sensor domain-containing diguanylate cyclase [Dongiaceae bacterium]
MANESPVHTDPQGFHFSASMEFLLHVIQQLSLARNLSTVQTLVRNAARRLTGCDGSTFVLRDGDFCHYVDEDAIAPLWKGQRFPMERCVSGWCMQHRVPAVVADVATDERIPEGLYQNTFIKSMVMAPVRTHAPIGAIGNYWARPHQPLLEEIQLLQALADAVSVTLENIQMYSELEYRVQERTRELQMALQQIHALSITDELSGLYNRRGFRLLADKIIRRVVRSGDCFSLVYLDLDGLKRVNDSQGHGVGDNMISAIANVLRQTFRESDILARIGGDEFCVLALGRSEDSAGMRRRLQARLDAYNQTSGQPFQLACSLGVVTGPVPGAITLDDLLHHADTRMYADKRARMAMASVSVPETATIN